MKGSTSVCCKSFFLPGGACAQLHNVSTYVALAVESETLDGTPDKIEHEAEWDTPNDEPERQAASGKPDINKFVGLILSSQRFDGHWSTAPCSGSLSCSMVV